MKYLHEKNKLKEFLVRNKNSFLYDTFKNGECMIAGGAIATIYNKQELKDIDVYFRSKQQHLEVLLNLIDNDFKCISETNKSSVWVNNELPTVNLSYIKYFENLQEVFDYFDFTVCMGGFDFKTESFEFHEAFMRDNLLKVLHYSLNSQFPIGALLRVKKYENKGYHISKRELLKIILDCYKLEFNSVEDLENQVVGMYGCNIKDIYNPTEEKFNLQDFIIALDDMDIEITKDSLNEWKILEINLYDQFSEFITATKIANKKQIFINNSLLEDELVELPEDMEFTPVQYPIKVYKWVNGKDPEDLCSFYKTSFKYKVGEMIEDNNNGIWCSISKDKVKNMTYSTHKNRILIEIEVEKESDFKNVDTFTQIYRGKFTKIIPMLDNKLTELF